MKMPGLGKKRLVRGRYFAATATAVLSMAAGGSVAQAANIVWSGAVSSDFENPGNWVGGVVPVNDTSTDFAVFDGPAANQPALTTDRSVGGLTFNTSGWTLGGSGFTLSKGSMAGYAIEMKAAGTVTIDANLNTENWFGMKLPAGSTLVIGGTVTASQNGPVVYNGGGGTVRLAGSQSNSMTQPYDGSNTLTWEFAKTNGATVWNGSARITNGSTYRWLDSNQIPGTPQGVLQGVGVTYDLNGNTQTFSQLIVPGNAPANTAATVTTGSGVAVLSYHTPLETQRTDMGAPLAVSGNVQFTANNGANVRVVRSPALAYDLDLSANIVSSVSNVVVTGGGIARFSSETGNSYVKNTTINNATTLLLANSSGSATGTGNVTVNTGGILAGDGIIVPGSGNSVTIASTGRLAPGASIGALTVSGDVELQSGGVFDFELGNAGAADRLDAANLTLAGTLDLSQLSGTSASGIYVLANYSGTLTGVFSDVTGLPTGYTLDYGAGTSDQITLVPEPAALSLLALGGLSLLRRQRRRI